MPLTIPDDKRIELADVIERILPLIPKRCDPTYTRMVADLMHDLRRGDVSWQDEMERRIESLGWRIDDLKDRLEDIG